MQCPGATDCRVGDECLEGVLCLTEEREKPHKARIAGIGGSPGSSAPSAVLGPERGEPIQAFRV